MIAGAKERAGFMDAPQMARINAIDCAKFFSRSHHAAFSKKTGSSLGRFKKHLAISPIPLPPVAAL